MSLLGTAAAALLLVPAAAGAAETVVSLTFDDGRATQYEARSLLAAHGMQGTFYVNSGVVPQDTPDYRMAWWQLHDLAADGNEIGGHTLDHAHLTQLSAAQQRVEICQDRQNLLDEGFPRVVSFAYPYGEFNATSRSLVEECGYLSARKSGGIRSESNCWDCPTAETIPPYDPWAIRAPDSIATGTSSSTMQRYVTQAESNGGGWVIFVFHSICDACDADSITVSRLSAFLDWLAPRAAGGTVVKAVRDVIDPPPPSPPPAPPASSPPSPPAPPASPTAAAAAPAPAPGPDGSSAVSAAGTAPRPVLSLLGMAPRRLHARRHGGSVGARRGARVSFWLGEPAVVVFRVQRKLPDGRFTAVPGRFAVPGATGVNGFRFSGRIGRRRLAPGVYRLGAVARDAAGAVSAPRRLAFRVVR